MKGIILAFLLIPCICFASETFFDPATYDTVAPFPYDIKAAYINDDPNQEFMDLVLTHGAQGGGVSILKGRGDGTFDTVHFTYGGGTINGWKRWIGLYVGDFNGDGKNDIAVGGGTDDNIKFLRNTSTGMNVSFDTFSLSTFPNQIDFLCGGDFDGDGDIDLAGSSDGLSHYIFIFENQGINSGNFSFVGRRQSTGAGGGIECFRLTQSTPKLSIVTFDLYTSSTARNIIVFRNNGSIPLGTQTFDTGQYYPLSSANANPQRVVAFDLNGDNAGDLAVTLKNVDSVALLRNNGYGAFNTLTHHPAGNKPTAIVAASLDTLDNIVDLAVSCSSSVALFRGVPNDTFQSAQYFSINGDEGYGITSADLIRDCDPMLDLAVTMFSGRQVAYLMDSDSLPCIAIPGDVDTSGVTGLTDVIYLTNYVFDKDRIFANPPDTCFGSDPGTCWPIDPLCRGDVNQTVPLSINLTDIVYLTNYVFDKDRPASNCLGIDPGNCWRPVPSCQCCKPQ